MSIRAGEREGPARAGRRGAFTLIELLVVIAIIALLMTLLMPAMGGIRRTGRAVQCNAGLRQMGVAWMSFARDHEGRGPGRASRSFTRNEPNNFTWIDILNHYMGQGMDVFPAGTSEPIQRWNYDVSTNPYIMRPRKNNLVCPELNLTADGVSAGGGWGRHLVVNSNAIGGENWINTAGASLQPGCWSIDFGPGRYGKIVPHPYFSPFCLGTPTSLFQKPAYTYLLIEGRRAHDDTNRPVPLASEANPLAATEAQPWGGFMAFRHPGLSSNYLMLDGHSERLASTDPTVAVRERWVPF